MAKRIFTQTFGVVGAIIEKDGKFLLVKEKKNSAKDKWSHPAGWIDLEENTIDAAKREIKEETGFNFEPENILGIYVLVKKELDDLHHAIKIIFTGNIAENQGEYMTDEISETKWFSPEEIEAMDSNILRDADIKTMVKDYLAGKKYPLDIITHTIQK
ncbi:MAG: NUDIX domain-containing protein [Candidatus Staskawiczbacteria bacterium]|nr:NUDIX domain-containing protein [Candidatus Staskawiczbacteria bacterium]